ncbi:MAG: aminoacyl-tRNA hydrolase [Candidatus Bipolaricaulota bacterium]|nr:aminoacyl-tRNA hydrolase [Candidatus Bipolaricaulota bacterium]
MKAVFGLGNPGTNYAFTRHNVGFQVIDLYRETKLLSGRAKFVSGAWLYWGEGMFLAKPIMWMNNSGSAVRPVLERFQVDLKDTLIIYDDLDLPLGRLRVLPKGGAGGHRGMSSVISALGSEEIPRLRIGIGGDRRPQDQVSYVLARFTPPEWECLLPVLESAVGVIDEFASGDINAAMNRFNRREHSTEQA